MTKILVLGHKGMLGNAVCSYLASLGTYEILTTDKRFGDEAFNAELKATDAEYIINCIGIIPQRKPDPSLYTLINIDLPVFLDSLGKKVIHPTTDCEFLGNIPADQQYAKNSVRDADDDYGKSKAISSEKIEKEFKNTKAIRVSIIGHELKSALSFLDWFLHAEGEVKGYTNHYWNGVTTLEWAKLAQKMIENWDAYPVINQYGTEKNLSKYEVLGIAKEVYGKDISIIPFAPPNGVNKCLQSDISLPDIRTQLIELKAFYNK